MSKVLIICARQYNGHELWTTLCTLQEHGHTFEVVSTKCKISDEVTYEANSVERTLYEVTLEEVKLFDGIMIVSGNMKDTEAYWTNKHVLSLVAAFNQQEQPIAAICCSVPTLREVVKGIHVAFFPLLRSRHILRSAGALLSTLTLCVDGRFVTAEHQMATEMWVNEYCNVLEGKPPIYNLTDSHFTPMGSERRFKPDIQAKIDHARSKK